MRAISASASRATALSPRLRQIYDMVERARQRGEAVPGVLDVTDYILSPLYVRALFGVPADESVADRLVARLLALSAVAP